MLESKVWVLPETDFHYCYYVMARCKTSEFIDIGFLCIPPAIDRLLNPCPKK